VALGRRRGLAAGAVVVAAAAVAVIILELLPGGSGPAGVRLAAAPLGVNIAPWDGVYSGSGDGVIQPMLAAAGIKQIRYGGGSYADFYDWQTNASIGNCLPEDPRASFTAGCASASQLSFRQLSARARAIGAESFVTVNYGSGTPALAAAWVTTAKNTAGEGVALWEVGNESYGCYEVNDPLADAPAHYRGYRPGTGSAAGQYQTCPTTTQGLVEGTKTLAASYAANALPFLRAMKAADPTARLGVPWLLGSSTAGAAGDGSSTASSEWNNTVLGTDGSYVGFVDAHYYPFFFSGAAGGGNPTDSQVLAALRSIPALASSTESALAAHDPGAELVIGETGVSSAATTTANNYGNSTNSCTKADYGFFTSAASPVPETAYYGYLLASALAKPGALLGPLTTSSPADVLAFQSSLPGGAHAVALINLDTSASHTVTFPVPAGLTGTLRSSVYSAGTQNSSNSNVVKGTTPASSLASGITLPAESITVLQTQ
jgi:hypothetical protein